MLSLAQFKGCIYRSTLGHKWKKNLSTDFKNLSRLICSLFSRSKTSILSFLRRSFKTSFSRLLDVQNYVVYDVVIYDDYNVDIFDALNDVFATSVLCHRWPMNFQDVCFFTGWPKTFFTSNNNLHILRFKVKLKVFTSNLLD